MDTQTPWEPFFAILPVWVDAYDASEIKNGKMRYRKVGWVLRSWREFTDVADEDQVVHKFWQYRLMKKGGNNKQDD